MTLLTAGALTDPRLPATASNVCTTDARLGGVGRVPHPPNKNPGYTGAIVLNNTNEVALYYSITINLYVVLFTPRADHQ